MIKLDKNRFHKYIQFSKNIEDRMIYNHVRDASRFDFMPKVPAELYNDIKAFSEKIVKTWDFKTSFTTGQETSLDDYIWKALADNSDSRPPSDDWQKLEISEAFTDFIEPYLVMSFYGRFLLWHGNNVTQFGLRSPFEDSSNAVSPQDRSQLIADTKRKAGVYWADFIKWMKEKNYTLDGGKYDFEKCDKSQNNKSTVKMFRI